MRVGNARSVTHQAAGFGVFAQGVDRRHPIVGRERNELDATVVGQRARADQPIYRVSRKACKSRSMSRPVLAKRTSVGLLMAEAAARTSETKVSVRGRLDRRPRQSGGLADCESCQEAKLLAQAHSPES